MEIIERLKKIRRNLGLSQARFASKIGLVQGSYCMIETGKDALSDRNIMLICQAFNVNEDWLRNGTGKMFNPPSTPQDEDEVRLLNLFRKLSKEMKQVVIHKINQLVVADNSWVPAQPEEPPEDIQKRA